MNQKSSVVMLAMLGLVSAGPVSASQAWTYQALFGPRPRVVAQNTQQAAEAQPVAVTTAALHPDPAATASQGPAASVAHDPAPAAAPQGRSVPAGQGERLITNVFMETDLRQALADIASQAGVVIIPDATVQGTVTADLQDVPLETALRMVLISAGLSFKKMDGYYLVGAADPTNPNFYLLSETEVVELNYLDGNAIAAYLAGPYGRFVTVEGAPPAEPERERPLERARTTQRTPVTRLPVGGTRLFITAPRDIIERIKADLALIDRPRTQVMLEAVVLEVSEEALKELGVDWATRWVRFASQETAVATGNATGGTQSSITFPASSLTYSELSFTETAQLTALVERGKARLKANPRVATVEGQTAEIEVGQEKYFSIVTGPVTFPYTTLEQIPAGISLRITPTVVESTREVIARIEPDVRDVTGKGATGLPEITYRRAVTNLRVKDGQSIVIGGLMSESTSRSTSKVPLLGDIPLLGHLFRRTVSRENKTEVIIVITPHILDESGSYAGQPPLPATAPSAPRD